MRITGIFTFLLFCYILPASGQVYRDTSFVPGVNEADPFYAQNMLYKARLDSIQETVPLPYNESVQKYIDIYASRKDQIGKVLGLAGYYFPIFEKSLKEYDIPQEIKFLSVVESALNPLRRACPSRQTQQRCGFAAGFGAQAQCTCGSGGATLDLIGAKTARCLFSRQIKDPG